MCCSFLLLYEKELIFESVEKVCYTAAVEWVNLSCWIAGYIMSFGELYSASKLWSVNNGLSCAMRVSGVSPQWRPMFIENVWIGSSFLCIPLELFQSEIYKPCSKFKSVIYGINCDVIYMALKVCESLRFIDGCFFLSIFGIELPKIVGSISGRWLESMSVDRCMALAWRFISQLRSKSWHEIFAF